MALSEEQRASCIEYIAAKEAEIASLRGRHNEISTRLGSIRHPRHKCFDYYSSCAHLQDSSFNEFECVLKLMSLALDQSNVGGPEWNKLQYRIKKSIQLSDKYQAEAEKVLYPSRSFAELDLSGLPPSQLVDIEFIQTNHRRCRELYASLVQDLDAQSGSVLDGHGLKKVKVGSAASGKVGIKGERLVSCTNGDRRFVPFHKDFDELNSDLATIRAFLSFHLGAPWYPMFNNNVGLLERGMEVCDCSAALVNMLLDPGSSAADIAVMTCKLDSMVEHFEALRAQSGGPCVPDPEDPNTAVAGEHKDLRSYWRLYGLCMMSFISLRVICLRRVADAQDLRARMSGTN